MYHGGNNTNLSQSSAPSSFFLTPHASLKKDFLTGRVTDSALCHERRSVSKVAISVCMHSAVLQRAMPAPGRGNSCAYATQQHWNQQCQSVVTAELLGIFWCLYPRTPLQIMQLKPFWRIDVKRTLQIPLCEVAEDSVDSKDLRLLNKPTNFKFSWTIRSMG